MDKKSFVRNLREEIMKDLAFGEELSDEQVQELISRYLLRKEEARGFSLQERTQMGREIFYSLRRLDVLQELLENEGITEIMVNGPTHIFVEHGHVVEEVEGLEYHTNLGAVQGQLFEDLHNILTAVLNVTTGGMLQKVHAANQGGLAAARRTNDTNNVTTMNIEADALQDFSFAKGFLQIADRNN